MIADLLHHARRLAWAGQDVAARTTYLDVLRLDPTHLDGLTELGALAHAGGYVSAARAAYCQAVASHPDSALAQVGYGDLLREAGDLAAACRHYRAALAADPELARAHQGLAWALSELGAPAEAHWHKGFAGHAVVRRRYRGSGPAIRLLLLVAAVGGNIPTQGWIDDRIYAVTAVYCDFLDPAAPLPAHDLIFNAIGDADRCAAALQAAEQIAARSGAPLLNPPARVRATGREANARRLGGLPGVVVPRVTRLSQAEPCFPLLLRAPGYHTGQHFLRVEDAAALPAAAAAMPCSDPLVIDYHDAHGADGMARKYRVMFIDGAVYPWHLAISADWKVHYFSAAMAADAALRQQEQRFLDDMPAVLGQRAMTALTRVQAVLGLDYAGIDFALTADGMLLLFECNATMVLAPPDADPLWDYRRPATAAAINAAGAMLLRRAAKDLHA